LRFPLTPDDSVVHHVLIQDRQYSFFMFHVILHQFIGECMWQMSGFSGIRRFDQCSYLLTTYNLLRTLLDNLLHRQHRLSCCFTEGDGNDEKMYVRNDF